MLNKDVKIFPTHNADAVLHNEWSRLNKNQFGDGQINFSLIKKRKRFVDVFEMDDNIDHQQAGCFCNDGGIGRTIKTNEDIDAWLADAKQLIIQGLQKGPVVIH